MVATGLVWLGTHLEEGSWLASIFGRKEKKVKNVTIKEVSSKVGVGKDTEMGL